MIQVKEHISIAEQKRILWHLLEQVTDPEIPVISIIDLGIVREVQVHKEDNGELKGSIIITPTYSGCPAMDVISMQIKMALLQEGITGIEIRQQLSPAWTTDWMTEKGRQELKAYGIAPPSPRGEENKIACPLCHSENTVLVSQFGSTACKALYKCNDCLEPFDYFKCH